MAEHPDFAGEASPERMVQAIAQNTAAATSAPHTGHATDDHPAESVRTAVHNGHSIVIRTRFEIEVDGMPFAAHINVDNAGRVQYHGLPTRDFASLVGLVERAIDAFPEDFPAQPVPQPGHHDHPQQPVTPTAHHEHHEEPGVPGPEQGHAGDPGPPKPGGVGYS